MTQKNLFGNINSAHVTGNMLLLEMRPLMDTDSYSSHCDMVPPTMFALQNPQDVEIYAKDATAVVGAWESPENYRLVFLRPRAPTWVNAFARAMTEKQVEKDARKISSRHYLSVPGYVTIGRIESGTIAAGEPRENDKQPWYFRLADWIFGPEEDTHSPV